MAGPARFRPAGRSSGTTTPSPGGSRRCGPARKTRGGPWSLARLRRRSRLLHDAAARKDLVTARPDSGGASPRPFPQTRLDRRADLLQTRPALPADLPAAQGRQPERWTQELLLARLPRLAHRRPPAARWADRPHLGQPQRPQGRRPAGVRRLTKLADHLLPAPYAPDLNPVEGSGHSCDGAGSPTSPSAPPNTSSSASDAAYGTSSTAATS